MFSPLPTVDGDFISPVSGVRWRKEGLTRSGGATIPQFRPNSNDALPAGLVQGQGITFDRLTVNSDTGVITTNLSSGAWQDLDDTIIAVRYRDAAYMNQGILYFGIASNGTPDNGSAKYIKTGNRGADWSDSVTGATAITNWVADATSMPMFDIAVLDRSVRCHGDDLFNHWVPLGFRLLTGIVAAGGCPAANVGEVLNVFLAEDGRAWIKGREPFTSALSAYTGVRWRALLAFSGDPKSTASHYTLAANEGGLGVDTLLRMRFDGNALHMEFDENLSAYAMANLRFLLRDAAGRIMEFAIPTGTAMANGIVDFAPTNYAEIKAWIDGMGSTFTLSFAAVDATRRCADEIRTSPWIIYDTLVSQDNPAQREFLFTEGGAVPPDQRPSSSWGFDSPGIADGRRYHDDFQGALEGKPIISNVNLSGHYMRVNPAAGTLKRAMEEGDAVLRASSGSNRKFTAPLSVAVIESDLKPSLDYAQFIPRSLSGNGG